MSVGSVLLVDDEEAFQESTHRLLVREGFCCQSINDAEEAIQSLRRERFDVLVSDIRMPHNRDLWIVKEAARSTADFLSSWSRAILRPIRRSAASTWRWMPISPNLSTSTNL